MMGNLITSRAATATGSTSRECRMDIVSPSAQERSNLSSGVTVNYGVNFLIQRNPTIATPAAVTVRGDDTSQPLLIDSQKAPTSEQVANHTDPEEAVLLDGGQQTYTDGTATGHFSIEEVRSYAARVENMEGQSGTSDTVMGQYLFQCQRQTDRYKHLYRTCCCINACEGFVLVLCVLLIEIASAIFEQLGLHLPGLIAAYLGLTFSLLDVALSVEWCYGIPPHRTFGSVLDYFGLVSAIWQCIHSTVGYIYFTLAGSENPIKMAAIMIILSICLLVREFLKRTKST